MAKLMIQSSGPHFEWWMDSRAITRRRKARTANPPAINVVRVPILSLLRRGAPSNVWRKAFAAVMH